MSKQVDSELIDTHASVHDLEKMERWKTGLANALPPKEGDFPIYAIFLVSGADLNAHKVFRHFRLVFEELEAGFENLIIFGQHGTSSTLLFFLSDLDLIWERVPVLLLSSNPTSADIIAITLPKGSHGADTPGLSLWNRALELIVDPIQRRSLSCLNGLAISKLIFRRGSLISTIDAGIGALQADHLT